MGFLDKLLGRRMAPAAFWTWFAKNASRFEGVPDASLVNELGAQLKRVNPELAFQIGQRELEISADGIRDMIPVVRDFVAAAPAIPGWTVHAFRQPAREIHGVDMRGRRYTVDDVFFEARRDARGTHLDLYIAGFGEAPEEVGRILFVLLDAAIGELAVMTAIATLEIHDASARRDTARPLGELRTAIG